MSASASSSSSPTRVSTGRDTDNPASIDAFIRKETQGLLEASWFKYDGPATAGGACGMALLVRVRPGEYRAWSTRPEHSSYPNAKVALARLAIEEGFKTFVSQNVRLVRAVPPDERNLNGPAESIGAHRGHLEKEAIRSNLCLPSTAHLEDPVGALVSAAAASGAMLDFHQLRNAQKNNRYGCLIRWEVDGSPTRSWVSDIVFGTEEDAKTAAALTALYSGDLKNSPQDPVAGPNHPYVLGEHKLDVSDSSLSPEELALGKTAEATVTPFSLAGNTEAPSVSEIGSVVAQDALEELAAVMPLDIPGVPLPTPSESVTVDGPAAESENAASSSSSPPNDPVAGPGPAHPSVPENFYWGHHPFVPFAAPVVPRYGSRSWAVATDITPLQTWRAHNYNGQFGEYIYMSNAPSTKRLCEHGNEPGLLRLANEVFTVPAQRAKNRKRTRI